MPAAPFVLQMAGQPGSGKSALARLVGHRTRALVLDKDVLKSAALDFGLEEAEAGPLAYETLFLLAEHFLGQNLAVILDSPSFYDSIPAKGAALASAACVPYYFIECVCPDLHELARRLRERPRLSSNPGDEALNHPSETIEPPGGHLRLDTTQPIEHCLATSLEYLGLDL